MTEIWKPIPGWEGYYSASNRGRIRRDTTGHILKPMPTARGYLVVGLVCPSIKQRPHCVHRLVLAAFVGPQPTPKHEGNHKDGVKTNNRASNLEWATRSENITHAYRTGLHKRYGGSSASAAKLTEAQVTEILTLIASRVPQRDIAKKYGVQPRSISAIASGKKWMHVSRPDMSKRRTGHHVLTEAQVGEIKGLLGCMSHGVIAERYGVSGPTIWHIADGRTWRHVKATVRKVPASL